MLLSPFAFRREVNWLTQEPPLSSSRLRRGYRCRVTRRTARLAVASLALSAAAADGSPPKKRVTNGLAAVGQLGREHHPIGSFLHDRNPSGFAAWIELEPVVTHGRHGHRAVLEK